MQRQPQIPIIKYRSGHSLPANHLTHKKGIQVTHIDLSTPAKTERLLRSARLSRGRRVRGKLQSGTKMLMRLRGQTINLALLRSDTWPSNDEWHDTVGSLPIHPNTLYEKLHNDKGFIIYAKNIPMNSRE